MKYMGSIGELLDIYHASSIDDYWQNKERDIEKKANAYVIFDRVILKEIGSYNLVASDKTGSLLLAKTHLLRNYEITNCEQMMFLKCAHPFKSPQLLSTNNLKELEKIAEESDVKISDLFMIDLAFNPA